MVAVATNAMQAGLKDAAEAIQNFIEACEALRGQVGREVVAEHLDLSLRRMQRLQRELASRAAQPANSDAVFVALGLGAAGLSSLAEAFSEMHRRYRATLPGSTPPMGWFDEEADEVPL
jgi:hypothetical protein